MCKDVRFTVTLERETVEKLEELAKKDHRTRASLIRKVLISATENDQQKAAG